jgi:hypothetical protein
MNEHGGNSVDRTRTLRRKHGAGETLRALGQSVLRQAAGGTEYQDTNACYSYLYCSQGCPDTNLPCSAQYCTQPTPAQCSGSTWQCPGGGGSYPEHCFSGGPGC